MIQKVNEMATVVARRCLGRPAVAAQEEELAELHRKLAELRRERRRRERALAERGAVERALAAAERDIDIMSSPELDELRAEVSDLMRRLRDAWNAADGWRAKRARLAAGGIDLAALQQVGRFDRALSAEAEG